MAYKNILPFDTCGLVDWIAEVYGLAVNGFDLRVGYMSTVAILSTSTQNFVLKCVDQKEDTQQALSAQNMRVADLRGHQIPVADCVMGKGQQYFYMRDGRILSLWTFLVGNGFEIGNRQQLHAAGVMMGNLHWVLAKEKVSTLSLSLGWLDRVEQLTHAWQTLAKVDENAKSLVAGLAKHLAKWAVPIEKEPPIVIHNDYRAQNLLFQGTEVSGILDLDDMCVSPRIWDVVYAVIFFQAVIADRPLNAKEMASFLKGYQAKNPLDASDLVVLPQWLGLALLKGLTLWGQICFIDKTNPNVEKWIDGYLPLLGEVEALGGMLQGELVG